MKRGRPRKNRLKILFVAAEAYPYAEVGGLSRIAYFLPRALAKRGHDVRIFIPRYGKIDQEKYPLEIIYKGLRVPTGGKPDHLVCNVKMDKPEEGLTVYFLENMEYYEKRANEYGYSDDPTRFSLLVRGALEYLRHSEWLPDVIHANDWHTGLLPQYIKTTYHKDPKISNIATVFTIHNLYYQGMFDHRYISPLEMDDGHSEIPNFFDKRINTINMMRRGIMYADFITTVSPTYAKEILTPKYGEGLDGLLAELRTKLTGILNGIDYDEFNPASDKIIVKNYDQASIEKRRENKIALQREFNLPEDPDIPIISYNGRLYSQKGLELVMETIEHLLDEYNVQCIVNGGGSNTYREFFFHLAKKYPEKVGVNVNFDFTIPRHIYAGADIIVIPSVFEPCGIVQMEAMRYGCVPIVRNTGGLADSVKDFDPTKNTGWGFTFDQFDKFAFFAAVVRALEAYRYQEVWQGIVERTMAQDFSWNNSAKLYDELYHRVIGLKVQKEESKVLVEM